MAVWFFSPPVVVDEGQGPTDIYEGSDAGGFYTQRWVNYFWKMNRGISVRKYDGVWSVGRFFQWNDINASTWFYYGGKISVVDDTNRNEIIAAGIGVDASNFAVAPSDTPLTPPPLGDDNLPIAPPYDATF